MALKLTHGSSCTRETVAIAWATVLAEAGCAGGPPE